MMNTHDKTIILVILALTGALLFSCAVHRNTALKHPENIGDTQMCSECHTDWRAALDHLDHRSGYMRKHKFYASQHKQACEVCHAESFCADCHTNKEEIKPSDKFKESPGRDLPHRGDYLNQHKIDGKINPASCVPCHGRQNNERCIVCHR
ncbi:MAG: cytochrome C [Nitrospirae bacterium]|nr:cytochrome C [Nitrospirota bacterium]